MAAKQQLKKFLLQNGTPLFSSKYEIHQAMYYQKLRKLFYSSLQYTPSLRWDISKIQDFMSETSCCNFTPLSVSQASALERSDQKCLRMELRNLFMISFNIRQQIAAAFSSLRIHCSSYCQSQNS